MTPEEFVAWERATKDTIDFKRCYAHAAGDVMAGLHLAQIVYWHLPNRHGACKLRVQHDGQWWVAASRDEWFDATCMTARQIDRTTRILAAPATANDYQRKPLIEARVWKFGGAPTTHIRILWDNFLAVIVDVVERGASLIELPKAQTKKREQIGDITKRKNGNHRLVKSKSPIGEMNITNRGEPLTETTTKTTTGDVSVSDTLDAPGVPPPASPPTDDGRRAYLKSLGVQGTALDNLCYKVVMDGVTCADIEGLINAARADFAARRAEFNAAAFLAVYPYRAGWTYQPPAPKRPAPAQAYNPPPAEFVTHQEVVTSRPRAVPPVFAVSTMTAAEKEELRRRKLQEARNGRRTVEAGPAQPSA